MTGHRRIYLGASPGVGKTHALLSEGLRRQARGTRVLIGSIETHQRTQLPSLSAAFEAVPLVDRSLDVDAILAREPQVVLVDDIGISERDRDIDRLVAAGVDVVGTVDLCHLERMRDVVFTFSQLLEVETIPDSWLRAADEIELVDMTPEALRKRVKHGHVVPFDEIDTALDGRFRLPTLIALRELSLLWMADIVEDGLEAVLRRHNVSDHHVARLIGYLRTAGAGACPPIIVTSHFTVDLAAAQVTALNGELVRLTHLEWELVRVLASRRGELVSHQELLREVWGPCYGTETNYLRTYLRLIRKKLEPDPTEPKYFITEPKRGYRFVG